MAAASPSRPLRYTSAHRASYVDSDPLVDPPDDRDQNVRRVANGIIALTMAGGGVAIPVPGLSSDGDAEAIYVSDFAGKGLVDWERRDFSGRTRYALVDTAQGKALRARADASASALYHEVDVDLTRTPCLSWQWRIADSHRNNENERRKTGDDYPARVYVVFNTGIGWWNMRAVNYVWSSHQPVGSHWPNAYTKKARMIAVASGSEATGSWQSQTRPVGADYRRLFGESPPRITAVAVMSDSDDLGTTAQAWYRAIRFHSANDGDCG